MPKKNKQIEPSDSGFFYDVAIQIRLIMRLLADPRVNPLLKLLPIGSLIYLVFPDFLPLNPIDDALVIGLGTYMFIELCPQDIVQEHKDALTKVVEGTWKDPSDQGSGLDDEDIIEAEFREK